MANPITSKYVGLILTQDQITIIDSNQYPRIKQYEPFFACRSSGKYFYAATNINGKTVFLHNLIMENHLKDLAKYFTVDHKNRMPWNNTINNLRISDKREQSINTKTCNKNTSGFKGVYYVNPIKNRKNDQGSWMAYCRDENGKKITRSFSIYFYGDDIAWEKAVEQRLMMEVYYSHYFNALCLGESEEYQISYDDIYNNPDITIIDNNERISKRNNSGTKGIYYRKPYSNRKGAWIANYYKNKKQKTRSFSGLSDDNNIKTMAIECLEKKIMKGKNYQICRNR